MYILGISCYYHDASAALLKDGAIVAAAAEERFTRKKHDISFPINAIDFCLKSQNIAIKDIDHIGFYEKPFLKFERLLSQHLESFPWSLKTFLSSIPSWLNEKLRVPKIIRKKLGYTKGVLFVEHHLAHAASSFLVSPFEEAAILTVDGVGEWTTTAMGKGKGNDIELVKEIRFPHSLGLLYSTITAYLGFTVNNGEYKCVHPLTSVLTGNGRLEPIENIFARPGILRKISLTEEIKELNRPVQVFSLDKDKLRFVQEKTNIVYRKEAHTNLYEVTLLSGRRVTVTPNHRFTSTDFSGEVFHREAKDLKSGDFVLIPRRIPLEGRKGGLGKEWAKLLAYSLAEGHEVLRREKHEAESRIGVADFEIIQQVKSLAKKLGLKWREWKQKGRPDLLQIGFSVWKRLAYLHEAGYHFGKRSPKKSVPSFVMEGTKAVQKAFLTGLFDCDGGFMGHQLIYASASPQLADQLTYLLLSFGIHCRIRKIRNEIYKRFYYRIEINGEDLVTFQKEIGFSLKRKKRKLSQYLRTIGTFGKNKDFVPINSYILEKWLAAGKNKIGLYRTVGRHFWDYEVKKRLPTLRMLKDVNSILKDKKIAKWITSDLYVDRVKKMRKVQFEGHVYDLVVPKHHTFVGGEGGIILHNTMGLAAYGTMDKNKNPYYKKLRSILDLREDGSFRFDLSYFSYTCKDRMPSQKLIRLLDGPVRKPSEEVTQRHQDIAAAVQLVTEEVLLKILDYLHHETKSENLVCAGGVALNSVFNGKILGNTKFRRVWIQPDAGDGGTSLGVASYIYHSLLGNKRSFRFQDAYLGPSFSAEEIKKFLDGNAIKYRECKDEKELIETAANLIFNNHVIGWFQMGMEWGPRALGARSILSNPCNPKMKEILNVKVKHRERFRPFAPVVCIDDAPKFFGCDMPTPEPTDFMLMVYPIKKEWQKKIPAVTHVDGSGRLQTVRSFQNPRFYDLIKEFGRLSGIPILINTSFNIRGEPIVCTPYDAYKCMMGTGIDYLLMDRFLISREDNPQDKWDSEVVAGD